jgi:MFS family permease
LNSVLISVGVAKAETRTLINGILQLTNYATAIFGAMMVDRLGRRFLFLASTIGMTVFFTRTFGLSCPA